MTKKAPERILLHCITSYPAPEDEYNISVLGSLAAVFGVRVGVSDHSLDPVLVPLAAAANGACMIEKHICLSRNDPGLDDPVALPPEQFARMTWNCAKQKEELRKQFWKISKPGTGTRRRLLFWETA